MLVRKIVLIHNQILQNKLKKVKLRKQEFKNYEILYILCII